MKDYNFFIPGYTGFCPELKEHFGKTYGHATRHIIQKKPHLKERLAPVHYKYRRYERVKGTSEKYLHHEQDKCDHLKSKHHADIHEHAKHRTDYEAGDTGKGLCDRDYGGDNIYPRKCCGDYESVGPCRVKYTAAYANCDKIRETDHECAYPTYIFIEGFAECVPPELRAHTGRQKLSPGRHSHAATSCAIAREPRDHHFPAKISFAPMPHVHLKEYHPEDCGHKKDAKIGTDCRTRKVPRVKPHRYGGVIPKYTGHVPGMQFSFGEAYGPVSDRLLQKHHDRMKELIKC